MTKQIITNTIHTPVGKYFSTLLSTLFVGMGILVMIFGVYGLTDFVTGFLQHAYHLSLQEATTAAQAYETVGRAFVSFAVIWRLATAITTMPKVDFRGLRDLFAERGALLAIIIAATMTASLQHRFYWWVQNVLDPDIFVFRNLEVAVSSNMIGTLCLVMSFILFYDKDESLVKPFWVTIAGTVLAVTAYWWTIFHV